MSMFDMRKLFETCKKEFEERKIPFYHMVCSKESFELQFHYYKSIKIHVNHKTKVISYTDEIGEYPVQEILLSWMKKEQIPYVLRVEDGTYISKHKNGKHVLSLYEKVREIYEEDFYKNEIKYVFDLKRKNIRLYYGRIDESFLMIELEKENIEEWYEKEKKENQNIQSFMNRLERFIQSKPTKQVVSISIWKTWEFYGEWTYHIDCIKEINTKELDQDTWDNLTKRYKEDRLEEQFSFAFIEKVKEIDPGVFYKRNGFSPKNICVLDKERYLHFWHYQEDTIEVSFDNQKVKLEKVEYFEEEKMKKAFETLVRSIKGERMHRMMSGEGNQTSILKRVADYFGLMGSDEIQTVCTGSVKSKEALKELEEYFMKQNGRELQKTKDRLIKTENYKFTIFKKRRELKIVENKQKMNTK